MRQVNLRSEPQTREFQSKLAMLVLGTALIIFSTWFSISVTFTPIVLMGDEWAFGPREVAHLFCFMGCVLAIWFCGNSFATRSTMFVSLSMAALGIGLVVIAIFAPREIKDMFNPKAVETSLWVLYYYLAGCVTAWFIQKKISQWVFQPRRMLVITALFLALISIGWEVYTQPFEHVYQKPPRGYVQFAQVLCDFVGIAIGYRLVGNIISRIEASGNAKAPTPDCANTLDFAKELWAQATIGANRIKHRLMRSAQKV